VSSGIDPFKIENYVWFTLLYGTN